MWFTFLLKENYTYSNYNGTFRYREVVWKGDKLEICLRRYDHFLRDNKNVEDKTLYRTFTLKPWRFWEWHELYLTPDRFSLPYISKEEIQKNRIREGLPVN
jgi:hypothetical protein